MVLKRKDQRLIDADRLAELEERAQDGIDMRAALQSLKPKHYQMMERCHRRDRAITDGRVRLAGSVTDVGAAIATGWLGFESDLGDQLAIIARRRAGTPKPTDPVDDEAPF